MVEHFVRALYEVSVLRANVPENEGQHLQSVYPPAIKHGGPGRFAFASEMNPTPPSDEQSAHLRDLLMESWGRYIVGDEPVLSEKSPPNLIKIEWLRKVFPGSKFLIVVRDPRAVAGATEKWSNSSLEELVFHWSVAHSIAIRSLKDDCLIIKYEDFCLSPHEVLEGVKLSRFVPLRKSPLEVDGRYKNLENTNDKYIKMHTCKNYGTGSWEYFSYRI